MANGTPATQAPEAAEPKISNDPYRSYNFRLEVGTIKAEAHFTQCTGLGIRVDSIEYREAGNNQVVRRIPGRVHYGEVTLRFGLTTSRDLWEWLMKAVEGRVKRENVTIVLLGPDGTDAPPTLRWDLMDAWPSEWRGAELDALGTEIAIASLTLVCDSIKLVPP